MSRKPQKQSTDWGNEVAHALGLIGAVFGKILTFIINTLLTIMLIGLITGTIVGGAFAIYVKNYIEVDISQFEVMSTGQSESTKIYYMDYTDRENRIGTPVEIETERLYSTSDRTYVDYNSMPSYLIEAFVSIEDHRFWDHKGVDWFRTGSAAINLFTGGKRFGGSTITQQLIKNVTGEDDVTIQRKVKEIFTALELEKTKDKTEIIEMYLNTIYLSQRSNGVQAAAYTYFGKDVSDLSLIECAALAAIPQFPTKYDPYLYPENNKERRNAVLDRMLELGKITQSEYDSAYDRDLIINYKGSKDKSQKEQESLTSEVNSWYTDEVIYDSVELLMENLGCTEKVAYNMIYNSGLHIYTVMDPEVQQILDEVFTEESNFPQAKGILQPECSMVIIDPATGDILGLRGGRGEKEGNLLLNCATMTTRPPGSSIKPISVYAPALEYGYVTYGSVLDDVPLNFGTESLDDEGNTVYSRSDGWPSNYPAGYKGLMTVKDAITTSQNTIALRTLNLLGIDNSFNFLSQKLHLGIIDSKELTGGRIVTDRDLAPLGLGQLSYGVSVEEITAAYAIFANNGVYNEPRTVIKILDSEGNVIVDNSGMGEVVISEQTASIMTLMLKNVVDAGTATRITLRYHVNCAGKTGTTSEDNDRWFVGYTPYYVGGVWFGYQIPKSLNNFSANPSVLVWDTVMSKLHEKFINEANTGGQAVKTFDLASGVITKAYCKDSGMLATDACRLDPRGSRTETGYFTNATAPTEYCTTHVMVEMCTSGGVANEACPNTKKVGLINVTDRSFPVEIFVADAQYVYRDIGDIAPGGTENQPYFSTALPEGTYVGISKAEKQYNRACTVHSTVPEVFLPEDELPEDGTADTGLASADPGLIG